jgi:hypothetical protein
MDAKGQMFECAPDLAGLHILTFNVRKDLTRVLAAKRTFEVAELNQDQWCRAGPVSDAVVEWTERFSASTSSTGSRFVPDGGEPSIHNRLATRTESRQHATIKTTLATWSIVVFHR